MEELAVLENGKMCKEKWKLCYNEKDGILGLFSEKRIEIPEGFKDTGIRVSLREKFSAIRAWCPDCKSYHLTVLACGRIPMKYRAYAVLTERYGCWQAYCRTGNMFWDLLKHKKDYELYIKLIEKIPYEYLEKIACDIYAMRNVAPVDPFKLAREALASLNKIYKT